MLRSEVRGAVDKGLFHIYAVDTVDQAMEILTGIPAGQARPDGEFPEGTINHQVRARLAELEEKRREASKGEDSGGPT
jgi:hypothetical protein